MFFANCGKFSCWIVVNSRQSILKRGFDMCAMQWEGIYLAISNQGIPAKRLNLSSSSLTINFAIWWEEPGNPKFRFLLPFCDATSCAGRLSPFIFHIVFFLENYLSERVWPACDGNFTSFVSKLSDQRWSALVKRRGPCLDALWPCTTLRTENPSNR